MLQRGDSRFAWINLAIFDAFSAGRAIEFTMERLPARDLTLSAAWAVFALGLLGLAFRTNTQALRWTSLAFLLLTIGKVFLYDLGELEDLYRVASLVGLAVSPIASGLLGATSIRAVFLVDALILGALAIVVSRLMITAPLRPTESLPTEEI